MNILTNRIEYSVADASHQGYLAFDDEIAGPRPGVMIVHEWWGLNDYIVRRAHMLAELGYVALAVDMYGGGRIAENPDEAGKLMNGVLGDMESGTAALKAGHQLLLGQPGVDPERTAAIGYCFGGAMVLHMARFGYDLDGVVSFHGSLGTEVPAKKGAVKAKVLVLHGADDPMVPEEQIAAFKQEMEAAEVDYTFIAYPGAKHAFTNEAATENGKKFGMPIEYNEAADEESWAEMAKFLAALYPTNRDPKTTP